MTAPNIPSPLMIKITILVPVYKSSCLTSTCEKDTPLTRQPTLQRLHVTSLLWKFQGGGGGAAPPPKRLWPCVPTLNNIGAMYLTSLEGLGLHYIRIGMPTYVVVYEY